jgi:hypothetical protein
MSRALFVAAILAAVLAAPTAQAQMFGHRKPPTQSGGQQIDCKAIAANPNAGMDEATCEQMLQAQQTYTAAQHDPAASRPGDEDMTCDQIKAEFMAQPMQAPSHEHVAVAQGATSDFMAKQSQFQAQATAEMAGVSAEQAAASAAGLVNPIAGRAAEAAATAHQEAVQAQLNAQAQAELTPRYRRMMSANGNMIGDMTSQMQDNPRIGRLVSLAEEKHCRGF